MRCSTLKVCWTLWTPARPARFLFLELIAIRHLRIQRCVKASLLFLLSAISVPRSPIFFGVLRDSQLRFVQQARLLDPHKPGSSLRTGRNLDLSSFLGPFVIDSRLTECDRFGTGPLWRRSLLLRLMGFHVNSVACGCAADSGTLGLGGMDFHHLVLQASGGPHGDLKTRLTNRTLATL